MNEGIEEENGEWFLSFFLNFLMKSVSDIKFFFIFLGKWEEENEQEMSGEHSG